MPPTPTLPELIRRALDSRLSEVHVSMPGRVVKYDASRETVDVQPQLRRAIEDDGENLEFEDLPVLFDVPIAWPSGGGGKHFITWPLESGDPVLLVFCERDIGAWRASGELTSPGDQRAHTLAGAVAYPGGVRADRDKLGSTRVGQKLTIGSEVFLGSASATEPMVLGNAFKAQYDTHVHPTAMGPSGPPTVLLTALSKVHKLDR